MGVNLSITCRYRTRVTTRADEHALSPPTKFDEDYIPAPLTAVPRVTDISHRRRYVFLALPLHFTTYSHYSTLPRVYYAVTFIARSPVRRSANICYVVIIRRPYPSPHRLCCVCSICFTFYFAFAPCYRFSICFHFMYKLLHTK